MYNTNIPDKYIRLIALSTSFLAFVVIVIVLRTLKAIFIPLTFSIFISFIYAPLNRFLIKYKIHTLIRILLLIAILFFVTYILIFLAYTGISKFALQFPQYQEKLISYIITIAQSIRISQEKIDFFIASQLNLFSIINTLSVNKIMSFFMNNFISILSYYMLTIFFSIFFLSDDQHFIMKLFKIFFTDKTKSEQIIKQIEKQLNTYILSKMFINLLSSFSSAFVIFLLGIDFPILSGFLIFMFGFIPEIGSVIAASFPILFCFLKFGLSWQLFLTIGLLLIINSGFGNLLEPKLMGYQFNLSPILILIVLIFWGWVWGPIGMLLAVPITAILNIIFKELDKFKQIRTMMNINE